MQRLGIEACLLGEVEEGHVELWDFLGVYRVILVLDEARHDGLGKGV